jgi:L-aspartate oxidase
MNTYYDVIIVGTGVAGCFTALHLPSNYQILMITKEAIDKSNSFLAQGGICVLQDFSDRESFIEDTLKAGHYKNNLEAVEIMVDASKEVISELEQYGVTFNKENQSYVYTREGAHSVPRILYHSDMTGKEITSKLLTEVKQKNNITIKEHTELLDILTLDNECYGAVIKKSDTNIVSIYANYVMLATGGVGGLFTHSTNFPHLQGDALRIAFKHQIGCQSLNYVQFHPTTLYSTKSGRRFLISESVRGEGALLYNNAKERFVDELLPRDKLTQAIYQQMEKDQQPFVWLSMKDISEVDIEKRFPTILAHCRSEGIDPQKEYIPVVPAQHYFMGGIKIDMLGHTSMEHLYAAGETACNGVHGKNRLASNSLLESLVFAKRAANDMGSKGNTFALEKAKQSKENILIDDIKIKEEVIKQVQGEK